MLILGYLFWCLFVFIGVVWIMVMIKNKGNICMSKKSMRLQKRLPSVSVIIPAHNEEKCISKTIKSILSLDYPRRLLEVIVVNDCSKDKTKKIAKGFSKKGLIRLISNKVNKGKGYSLNRGIAASRGDLVVCMDADSTVKRNALKKMVPHFRNPDIAAVTPALKIINTKNKLEKMQYIEYIFNVFFRKMLGFLDAIHVTPGAFSIYRKSVLQEIGGFDEHNLTEDMDIALRIHKAGYRIENELGAVSFTECPSKWGQLYKQRMRWYRGAMYNSIKHRDLLFNRKYGNLGFFYMPINVIAIAAIIFIFVTFLLSYSSMLGDWLYKMSLINWDFGYVVASIPGAISGLLATPLVLLIIGFVLGIYMIYISFKYIGEKRERGKISYIGYLVFYPITIMLFWTVAMLYELFRIKKNW